MFRLRALSISLLLGTASVVNAVDGWTYLGCFTDNTQARTLHYIASSSDDNTVESCLGACAAGGYALGGVEYGRECYCGNALLYDYGSSEACNFLCSGNSDEICGGSNAIDVYQNGDMPYTTGPASWLQSYGEWITTPCWDDSDWHFGGQRILPDWPEVPIPAEEMTVERCIDGCSSSGYNTAGVEWGQECWCGNVNFPPGESDPVNPCTMPCLGNAGEYCGGSDAIILYTTLAHFLGED